MPIKESMARDSVCLGMTMGVRVMIMLALPDVVQVYHIQRETHPAEDIMVLERHK